MNVLADYFLKKYGDQITSPSEYIESSEKAYYEKIRKVRKDIELNGRFGERNGIIFLRNGNELTTKEAFGPNAVISAASNKSEDLQPQD